MGDGDGDGDDDTSFMPGLPQTNGTGKTVVLFHHVKKKTAERCFPESRKVRTLIYII